MSRIVLVTGAASGLGAAVAAGVTARGDRAVVLDRVPVEGYDGEIVDLADGRAAEYAVARIVEQAGGLDAVVTCAGIDACGTLEDVDAKAWEQVVAVNLLGTVAVVRAALPALRESHGRVVTVGSTLGLKALSDATAYCASKFGVVGFSRALAAELRGQVGVTLCIPGGMRTPFFDGRPEQYKPAPDARLSDPADVAGAILAALVMPAGVEMRELVVCVDTEPSWP